MPKQVWNGNKLEIQLDPGDPKDAIELKVLSHKGNSIQAMAPAQMQDLLIALNEKYNLGLNP